MIAPRVPIVSLLGAGRFEMNHGVAGDIDALFIIRRTFQGTVLVLSPPLLDDAFGTAGHGQRVSCPRLAGGF